MWQIKEREVYSFCRIEVKKRGLNLSTLFSSKSKICARFVETKLKESINVYDDCE